MERIERKIRTVYGKDLHDSHTSVTVRLNTDELEHGDTIEIVAKRVTSDESSENNSDSKERNNE